MMYATVEVHRGVGPEVLVTRVASAVGNHPDAAAVVWQEPPLGGLWRAVAPRVFSADDAGFAEVASALVADLTVADADRSGVRSLSVALLGNRSSVWFGRLTGVDGERVGWCSRASSVAGRAFLTLDLAAPRRDVSCLPPEVEATTARFELGNTSVDFVAGDRAAVAVASYRDVQPRLRAAGTVGLPCSEGRAIGRCAFDAQDVDEILAAGDGAILVTPLLEPDLVSAAQRANGLVLTSGGLTSHGAVVARALQRPAVVVLDPAVTVGLRQPGVSVVIDGSTGEIEWSVLGALPLSECP